VDFDVDLGAKLEPSWSQVEIKIIKKTIIMTPKIFQILINAPYFGIVNILK